VSACALFLLVLTPAAWESPWVQDELQLALAERKRILTVVHQPTQQAGGFIRIYQWIKAAGLEGSAAAELVLQKLSIAQNGIRHVNKTSKEVSDPNNRGIMVRNWMVRAGSIISLFLIILARVFAVLNIPTRYVLANVMAYAALVPSFIAMSALTYLAVKYKYWQWLRLWIVVLILGGFLVYIPIYFITGNVPYYFVPIIPLITGFINPTRKG